MHGASSQLCRLLYQNESVHNGNLKLLDKAVS